MKKKKIDRAAIIDCGNEEIARLAYVAMFRYAFGRMTYMPSTVIGIIKGNADTLTPQTLELLDRDLSDKQAIWEDFCQWVRSSSLGCASDPSAGDAFEWILAPAAERKGERDGK